MTTQLNQTTNDREHKIRLRIKDVLIAAGITTLDQSLFITEESYLTSICGDSLDVMEALIFIEEEFEINIDANPTTMVTAGDLYNYIYKEYKGA